MGEAGAVGEGSRTHNELKQDMAEKIRTLCWHTEEGTEYIHCNYPQPFKKEKSQEQPEEKQKSRGAGQPRGHRVICRWRRA